MNIQYKRQTFIELYKYGGCLLTFVEAGRTRDISYREREKEYSQSTELKSLNSFMEGGGDGGDLLKKEGRGGESTAASLDGMEAILNYEFRDKRLLEEAFTDASYSPENCSSFERLEYVGDSVLNFLITREQYFSNPNLSPGSLTRLRAANVDTEKLARVAITHGFHRYLRHNKADLDQKVSTDCFDFSSFSSTSLNFLCFLLLVS